MIGINEADSGKVFNWTLCMYGTGVVLGINLAIGFELPVAFIVTVFAGSVLRQLTSKEHGATWKIELTAAALGCFLGVLLGTCIYSGPLQLSIQTVPKASSTFKYLFWGPLGAVKYILIEVLGLGMEVS